MANLSNKELENVAREYEERLTPVLFQQWADRLVDIARVGPGQRVLDVACGTGILARTVAKHVVPGGSVSGVDVNPAMLSVAGKISPDINWQEAPAESLPFEDDSFDAVVSQFGLMFFEDKGSAIKEMIRVMRPGGRLAVAVFDSLENIPAYAALADVYGKVVGKEIGDALRFPFSMREKDLKSFINKAGINSAVVKHEQGTAKFLDVRSMVLADVEGWFPFARIHLNEELIEAVIKEAGKTLKPFITSEGEVEFDVPVNIVAIERQ